MNGPSEVLIDSPSDDLLQRLNGRVHPICDMIRRPERLRAVYRVPERYLGWFCNHCMDLGIRTHRAADPIARGLLAGEDLDES